MTVLARYTTLELGGPADQLIEVRTESEQIAAVRNAAQARRPWLLIGGGSNLVVADAGWRGVAIVVRTRGLEANRTGDEVELVVAAGEPWDDVVARAVDEGWAGIEALSGIPGSVGATPIQNVGAYGQDVAETIRAVRVLDTRDFVIRDLTAADCAFGYRDSGFRRQPGRFVVLAVRFALRLGGAPAIRYPELATALSGRNPTLSETRAAVLALRRKKSMVIDPADENRRSVGSFFVNPVVTPALADAVAARVHPLPMPRYPATGGVKLSAAWLIERAGFVKGERRGGVGLSSRHALALVHHGGATAAALVALAREIRDRVAAQFDVELRPEPVFAGFDEFPL